MSLDTPALACPWGLRPSLEAYILRRGAVSASCRLTTSEELALLRRVLEPERVDDADAAPEHRNSFERDERTLSRTPPARRLSEDRTRTNGHALPRSPFGGGGSSKAPFGAHVPEMMLSSAEALGSTSTRELRLREYLSTLESIETLASGGDDSNGGGGGGDGNNGEGGGCGAGGGSGGGRDGKARVDGSIMLRELRPRSRPLAHAQWIDVSARPSQLLSLDADDPQIKGAQLDYYQKPPNNYDEEALDELMRVWRSLSITRHFMLLYELLTGQVRLKIDKRDSAATLGTLLVRSLPLHEWRHGSPLVSLLLLLTRERSALAELHAPAAGFTAAVASGAAAVSRMQSRGESAVDVLAAERPLPRGTRSSMFDDPRAGAPKLPPPEVVRDAPYSLAAALPRYADIRKEKELEEASGQKLQRALKSMVIGDEIARMLVIRAHEVLTAAVADGHVSPPSVPSPLDSASWYIGDGPEPLVMPSARFERLVLSPRVGDHACVLRTLSASAPPVEACRPDVADGAGASVGVAAGMAGGEHSPLPVSADFLRGMSHQPLHPLGLSQIVCASHELEPPAFSTESAYSPGVTQDTFPPGARGGSAEETLPASELSEIFDLSNHPQARSYTASAMLRRLEADVRHFSGQYAHERLHLRHLTPSDVYECVDEARDGPRDAASSRSPPVRTSFLESLTSGLGHAPPPPSKLDDALDAVGRLIASLDVLHRDDTIAMRAGLTAATALANSALDERSSRADLLHHLRTLSGDEVRLSFPAVAAQLLASTADADLIALNPQLHATGRLDGLLRVAAATLLRTTRLAYVAQCRSAARALLARMQSLRERVPELPPWMLDQECRELATRSGSLATALSVQRHTLHPAPEHAPYGADPSTTYGYDPRFAIFEFTASVFLREGQVRLVDECVSTLQTGKSLVCQMIMGAGKTSTILPLLALLYADGTQLMMQVVPNSLLVFTLNVLRSRFSSVVPKAVYTFHFERATDVSGALLEKLHAAVERRAVVVTTPNALKSFALRFVELAHTLDYMSRAEPGKEASLPSWIQNVQLMLHGGRHSTRAQQEDAQLAALREQVRLCRDVLGLFQDGVLVLDEVDTILHPLRSELNWPLGGKVPLDFTTDKEAPGMRWLLPFHALDPFFFATGGQCVMEVQNSPQAQKLLRRIEHAVQRGCNEQALQRVPHLVLLDRRFYRTTLRPLLGQWLLLLLLQLGLRALDYEEALHYLNGEAHRVPPSKLRDLSVDGKQLKLLNLAFELLETIGASVGLDPPTGSLRPCCPACLPCLLTRDWWIKIALRSAVCPLKGRPRRLRAALNRPAAPLPHTARRCRAAQAAAAGSAVHWQGRALKGIRVLAP